MAGGADAHVQRLWACRGPAWLACIARCAARTGVRRATAAPCFAAKLRHAKVFDTKIHKILAKAVHYGQRKRKRN